MITFKDFLNRTSRQHNLKKQPSLNILLKNELNLYKSYIKIVSTTTIDSKKLLDSYPLPNGEIGNVTNWFNGSILRYKNKNIFSYRMEIPKPFFENQKLGIVELDDNMQPIKKTNKLLDLHSNFVGYHVEDPRLFENNGDLMLAYTDGYEMALANLTKNTSEYLKKPQTNVLDHDGREKNWTPFSYNNKVHFVYHTAPNHIVVDLENNIYIEKNPIKYKYGQIRGGTPAYNMGDYYLTFFHSALPMNSHKWGRIYFVGAYTFENKPPFKPIAYTPEPLLMGEFFDMGILRPSNLVFVVFPCGAIYDGNNWKVSFGYQDYENRIFNIKHEQLLKLMKKI